MNTKSLRHTGFWLLVSAALLSSLIPGGPIENRDFSHIPPLVLALFNIFLTGLDLGAVVLALIAFRGQSWAAKGAFIAAICFFGVYAVDLAQLFPRSPTPMSFGLALVEVLGMTAAIPLMFAARTAMSEKDQRSTKPGVNFLGFAGLAVLGVLALSIVWFATDAAMSGSSL